MTGESAGYSLADIGALMNNRDGNMWGNDSSFLILFLLIAMSNGSWGGWGNRGFGYGNESLTRTDMFEGFNNQNVMRKLDGITQGLCDGFYATNTNMLQGQNQLQRDLCQGFASVNAGISENRFDAQKCCCETNRNIDAVRYENARNTCDIVRAIEKDGDKTRALINANTMDMLRAKLAEKDQALQTANFQLSQQAQSASLIGTLRPFPQPAYITCSPYQSAPGYGYNYGYGCGCAGY